MKMITSQNDNVIERATQDLKNGFSSFFNFSLSLIETLTEKNDHLKFAVVNMQIALELFLKYYFLKKKMPERVFKSSKDKIDYQDFQQVLGSYFSVERTKQFVKKKHLESILYSRNDIVHKGHYLEYDEELANCIISCAFFIQGKSKTEFSETLIMTEYQSNKLSTNRIWREGAEEHARKVTSLFNEIALVCPHCSSLALVDKEIFNFDEKGSIEGLQCLTCFQEVDTEISGILITCYSCDKKTYYVDKLNEQSDQIYLGGCLNCGFKMDVRRCSNCDKFYYPDIQQNEVFFNNNYFCSKDCSEFFQEIHS